MYPRGCYRNSSTEEAHRNGILSAASLMVGAAAAADAVERARRLPKLKVGLHVVLVDGDPVSERAHVPALIDRSGRLRNDLARYGAALALSPAARRQAKQTIRTTTCSRSTLSPG
jgi:chitin disaccharide deacetylase